MCHELLSISHSAAGRGRPAARLTDTHRLKEGILFYRLYDKGAIINKADNTRPSRPLALRLAIDIL